MQSDRAVAAAFIASFLEMTVIPIPVEAALTPAMIAAPRRRWALAVAALGGSVLCAIAWYVLAAEVAEGLGQDLATLVGGKETLDEMQRRAEEQGFGFVFLAGITPVPFQIACFAAGLVGMAFGSFLLASVFARGIRYLGLAALVSVVGERARRWVLERKWALALLMVLVGVGLFGLGTALEALFSAS